jgi:exopolyphosphatase/guanosine-5'-triphosphate,3'-diphosphate pyrophosphatase
MTQRVAAIDCGTNSLRLLIADVDPASGQLTDVQRRMEIVRLGQGVDATGMLAPAALARTLGVLAEYADSIKLAKVGAVRMVATSATRDAGNAEEFSRGVLAVLGVQPEVITGAEEASLSFTGATAELAGAPPGTGGPAGPRPPYLVVDIGGGSTEFVLGSPAAPGLAADVGGQSGDGSGEPVMIGGEPAVGGPSPGQLAGISVDIGCVRLTERHLQADPPTVAQIAAASADIDAALANVAEAVPVRQAHTLVGLAGSVTTVAAVALELPVYDAERTHHARLSAATVHAVTERLLHQTHEQRAAIGSMHPGRVDVIGAGALVLDRVLQVFGFAEVVASEHDILDGIAWSIAGPGE